MPDLILTVDGLQDRKHVMTHAWREVQEQGPNMPWAASWIIHAPWAHPIWSQYTLSIYDLTTPITGKPKCRLCLPNATHEFLVYALDPDHRIQRDAPFTKQKIHRLHPPNYGYQLRFDSNEKALERLQGIVDRIVTKRLSPDTDYRSYWDKIFYDGVSLIRSALEPQMRTPPNVVPS